MRRRTKFHVGFLSELSKSFHQPETFINRHRKNITILWRNSIISMELKVRLDIVAKQAMRL
jgi:hypothetical protein